MSDVNLSRIGMKAVTQWRVTAFCIGFRNWGLTVGMT
jgi:hypothetical protein